MQQSLSTQRPPRKGPIYGFWLPALLALVLIFPLIELPRPSLITAPPWRIELLSSVLLMYGLFFGRVDLEAGFRSLRSSSGTYILFRFLLLFAAWSGLSIFWSDAKGPAIHHTFLWAVYLTTLIVLLSLMISSGHKLVSDVAVLVAIVLGVLCLIDYASIVDFSISEGTLRIRWAKYAELLVTLSPFLWAVLLFKGKHKNPVIWTAAALSWITAMLSLSKAAFIAGVIGFGLLFAGTLIFSGRSFRRPLAIIFAAWLLLTVGTQAAFTYFSSVPSTVQYISGTADQTRTTSSMRVFTWKVAADMIRHRPFLGVGANNFGNSFNEGRAEYAAANPNDRETAIGEDYLFERAHNEYLQIAAELGVVGLGSFAAVFGLFAFLMMRAFVRHCGHVSPLFIASAAGMAAFGVSSLFTSFSFRAMQNGLVFFAMMAVAMYELVKLDKRAAITVLTDHNKADSRWYVFALGSFSAAGLLFVSVAIAISNALIVVAERRSSLAESEPAFTNALRFFPDNAGGHYAYGVALAKAEQFDRAAEQFDLAARFGAGANITYSSMALARRSAGDIAGSERSLRDGIRVFPRSQFLRARLVIFLEEHGRENDAEKEFQIAREMDLRQANGWYWLVRLGSKEAYQRSKGDPQIAAPAELVPANAIYMYLNETMGPARGSE